MILKTGNYACFSKDEYKLFQELDDTFLSLVEDMEPQFIHIPALIDGEVLVKCGYFHSFPHQIISAGFVKDSCCDSVIDQKKISLNHIELREKYLTPSACLHIYPMLENQGCLENQVLTTKARVYRSEKDNTDITRLTDFSVRELVFIGSRDYVLEKLDLVFNRTLHFAKTITEKAKIITANDHFYPTKQNKVKVRIQRINNFKKELIIPVGGNDVAVASANFHDYHFSIPFRFDNNKEIVSACIGFGMERWLAACLEHKKSIHKTVGV